MHAARLSAVLTDDAAHQIMMTVDTVVLQNRGVARSDSNWLVKVLKGETLGMPEAVLRLGEVLAHQVVGRVAIVARRHRVMAGVLPAGIVVAHDVAVHAGLRIVAEIGPSLREGEGVTTRANQDADQRGE